jgi:hypothetical protein
MVSALVDFVGAIMASGQVPIDTAIVRLVMVVPLAGSTLALALSFGLETRHVTRN